MTCVDVLYHSFGDISIYLWLSQIGGGVIEAGSVAESDFWQNGALRRTLLLMNETTSAESFLRGLSTTRQTYITLSLSLSGCRWC